MRLYLSNLGCEMIHLYLASLQVRLYLLSRRDLALLLEVRRALERFKIVLSPIIVHKLPMKSNYRNLTRCIILGGTSTHKGVCEGDVVEDTLGRLDGNQQLPAFARRYNSDDPMDYGRSQPLWIAMTSILFLLLCHPITGLLVNYGGRL